MGKEKFDKKEWMEKSMQMKGQMHDMIFQMAETYITNPEAIAEYMAFSSKFYRYSVKNTMLIYSQNQGASFVQSFLDWKSMGVKIRKGQKGMKIFVPVQKTFLKKGSEIVPLSEASPEWKKAYKEKKIEVLKRTVFKVGNVFDISQTDFPKERYPELVTMGYPEVYHARLFDAVSEFAATALSCPVRVEDMASVTLRGYYVPSKNEIAINHLLEDTHRLSTLAHETGHAMIHRDAGEKSLAQIEFEGDCVGIMMESRFGIMPVDKRKEHLAQHFGTLKEEIISTLGEDALIKELDKIFSDVYSIYNGYTEALDACVQRHVPAEELNMKKESFLDRMIKEASMKNPDAALSHPDHGMDMDDGLSI